MRRGGGGGGRGSGGKGGRSGGGGAGSGRRDARHGGASYRDDRGRRSDYRSRRTPSPDRRPRRPRGEDNDRDRSPPRGGRMGYGDRSPPRGGRIGYGDRSPPRGGRSPPRRERAGYGGDRDASPRRGHAPHKDAFGPLGGDRHASPRGRREYGDSRGSPRGARDYERSPYREERDRYDRPVRVADLGHDSPPAYMLPDHPSDLGRPASLRAGRKESDYFGGSGDDRSLLKDDYLGGGGLTLRISATEMGRTSAMHFQDRRLSPPPPLYPTVPHETGFLTGGSAMKASDGYVAGNTQRLHDDGNFKYHKNAPYIESRDTERHYSGSRDLVVEKGGGAERFYDDVPAGRIRETEMLYSRRGIGDSSSALLAKDHNPYRMHTEPGYETSNGYNMDGLGRSSHDSLGYGSGHPHRLSGSPLEHGSGHGDETLLDIERQAHSRHTPRAASLEYDGHDTYTASENIRGNVPLNSRHISGSTSLRGLRDERINDNLRLSHMIEEDKSSFEEAMHQDTEHLIQHSYGGDASVKYLTARGGDDRYSHSPGTEPIGISRRPARQHEFDSFGYSSDQEASLVVSRKRGRSPEYHDHEIDVYQADHGFAGHEYYDDDIDEYDLPPPRMPRYVMFDGDECDERHDVPTNGDVFSRLALPHETYGEWTDMDRGNHPHSDILGYGYSKHVPMYQRLSRPNFHSQFGEAPMHGRGRGRGRGGLTKSAKKRLKTAPHQFDGGYPSDRNEFVRPNKFSKSAKDEPNGSEVKHEDAPEYEDPPLQKDPPEGSEEFSKQVEEAFLKYTKILNESPATQKKYREASKGSLSCCVCRSVARKFPDLDALLSHAYDTCKAGLKTKHLGFHKALCVLMGCNWHVAPDTSKAHYSIPSEEINAMREDLMLWPPVVVIQNSSTGNEAKDTGAKVVSIEEIEGVLADIGVPPEKARVSHGRPANQSVFLVKFQPTISGFQEAMRVHTHFSIRNHGKEEFQLLRGSKGKKAASTESLEELLYAHIGVVEDLGLLDDGTKKRCKVRSKKEIEADADATLNLEP
ncbi:uncharacterized protein [Miscanthus floridulus]|uniref:uncharacterized protein n=1 Tax=Miscanthus floridulus TaxID=154761 RepID=UPI00345848CD